jgi:uncharacterized protein (TIGR02611 family)
MFKVALRHTKRVVIAVVGITVILIGIAFFVLPGPGLLIIIVGLAILATEFAWAQGLLHKARERYELTKDKIKARLDENKKS